jgi:6,7-dimethyl-8-ribityllumazine synthase
MTKALIIEADFYAHISSHLRTGAILALKDADVEHDIITVPGALEIPTALLFVIEENLKAYDCFVALGCIIRGETSHYDIVCNESARGLYDLALRYSLALGNGILTVENEDQALERADPQRKDKGGAAVKAALRMQELKKKYTA